MDCDSECCSYLFEKAKDKFQDKLEEEITDSQKKFSLFFKILFDLIHLVTTYGSVKVYLSVNTEAYKQIGTTLAVLLSIQVLMDIYFALLFLLGDKENAQKGYQGIYCSPDWKKWPLITVFVRDVSFCASLIFSCLFFIDQSYFKRLEYSSNVDLFIFIGFLSSVVRCFGGRFTRMRKLSIYWRLLYVFVLVCLPLSITVGIYGVKAQGLASYDVTCFPTSSTAETFQFTSGKLFEYSQTIDSSLCLTASTFFDFLSCSPPLNAEICIEFINNLGETNLLTTNPFNFFVSQAGQTVCTWSCQPTGTYH